MKKFLLIIISMLLSFAAFSKNKDYSADEYYFFNMIWTSWYYVTPDKVYEWNVEEGYLKTYDRSTVRLDGNGYFYFGNKIFLPGLRYLSFDTEMGWRRILHSDYESKESYFGKIKFESSSFLSEKIKGKTINYSADNLGEFLCYTDEKYTGGVRLYDDAIPWVEGVKGYGIGEYFTLTTDKPFKTVKF